MKTLRIVTVTVLALVLSSCVNKDKGEPLDILVDLTATMQQAVDGAVLLAVDDFVNETAALHTTSDSFCAAIDTPNLTALQQRWRQVLESWYRLSLYNFGPLNDDAIFPVFTFIDSLRLQGTDYTASVRNEISADLAGSHTLDSTYFAAKSFNLVGLLALELLIFETAGTEHSLDAADIVAEYQAQSRKCGVLRGLAEQLASRALYVQNGWRIAYKNSTEPYRELFLNNQADDGFDNSVQMLIATVQEYLDYLDQRNVVNNAAQISQHSWDAIAASIDEIEFLLTGANNPDVDSFFDKMIGTGNQNAVDTVNTNIAAVRQAITDRNAAMLEVALGQLDGNFKREIPDSLDVVLGLNFSDGD